MTKQFFVAVKISSFFLIEEICDQFYYYAKNIFLNYLVSFFYFVAKTVIELYLFNIHALSQDIEYGSLTIALNGQLLNVFE